MLRPRIKRVHNALRKPDGSIRVGTNQVGIGGDIPDPDGDVWTLVRLLDGSRSEAEIVAELAGTLDEESVRDAIATLASNGYLEDAGAPPPPELSAAELARYDRNLHYFAWVDGKPRASRFEHQARLKRARVTVLGIGGAGSALATSLVAAGVGAVHCVDCDRVEVTNLNRQLLFTEDDVGEPKVEAAVRRLSRLNSHVRVTGEELRATCADDVVPLMRGRDLFCLCADQPPLLLPRWINEAAVRTRTPWMLSAYAGPMIVVGLLVPFETPCYACFEEHGAAVKATLLREDSELVYTDKAPNAVLAPTANLSGHFGALEAIRFLTGLEPFARGRFHHQNLIDYAHTFCLEAPRWSACPICGKP